MAVLALLSPLLILAWAALAYALSLLAALVSLTGAAAALVGQYDASIRLLFDPPVLPTIVPRTIVLALLVVLAVLVGAAVRAARQAGTRRRFRGAVWWQLVGSPLDTGEPAGTLADALWALVRGASNAPRPASAEIGRRYADLLTENFGQPGFREVILAVHDLDGRRDLVGALLPEPMRTAAAAGRGPHVLREAELVDLTSPPLRPLVLDFLLGALRLPVASAPHLIPFPAESYWRGERHRLCDRPELVARLIDEIAGAAIEQVILVSPAPPPAEPHTMRSRPVDLRGRMGEVLRSVETAALLDATTAAVSRFSGVFVVRPDHNPVGPFDFVGAYDEASDRTHGVLELMHQGYEDAYRQFIEPVVASGDRLEAI